MSKIEELLESVTVEWKRLSEVCEFKRGQTITKKVIVPGDVPVVGGGQKPAYYHNESNRPAGTITVSGSGAYAGYVSFWDMPIFLSDAFSIMPNKEALDIRYLYHWLLNVQEKIFALKTGSGIPHVYIRDLEKFEIPLPPLSVQREVSKKLDILVKYVTELQAELQAELQDRFKQYSYYRDRLLSEEYLNMLAACLEKKTEIDTVKWCTLGEVATIGRGGISKAD